MFDNRGGIKFLYLCSNFSAPGIIGLYGIYGGREEREEGGGGGKTKLGILQRQNIRKHDLKETKNENKKTFKEEDNRHAIYTNPGLVPKTRNTKK